MAYLFYACVAAEASTRDRNRLKPAEMMKHRCPVCKKPVSMSDSTKSMLPKCFPFCSQRCRLIDLGLWLEQKYTVSADDEPPRSCEPEDSDNAD
jgi:hypothetical protein